MWNNGWMLILILKLTDMEEREAELKKYLEKENLPEGIGIIGDAVYEEYKIPQKGTFDWYLKKAEKAPDKANMGLFGEHGKEYWLKKAEQVKLKEESAQSKLDNLRKKLEVPNNNELDKMSKDTEKSAKEIELKVSKYKIKGDTASMTKEQEKELPDKLSKEGKSDIKKDSGKITRDDIKIDGKTYEDSLTDLNKELDSKYGIDALTGNLTGFEIPEEYKLTGSETKEEKALKIEKQNEFMAKDQELAYKQLENKFDSRAGLLEKMNNNSEFEKSVKDVVDKGIDSDTFKYEYDEKGNIINVPGLLEDNVYNPETDDLGVRDAKLIAQHSQAEEILEGIRTKKSTELINKDKNLEKSIEGKSSQETIIEEGISEEIKKPEKGSYEWYMEKANKAKNKADMSFWDKLTGRHSKEYYLEQAEKVKPRENAKEITPDKDTKSSIKPENSQESSVMSPRGIPYSQNDIDYLLNNGYTPEAAYELLAKHPKYMEIDMSKVPKAPNGKEFSEEDIRNLLIKGYKMEDAINLLSKDKKYALEGVSKQEQATKEVGDTAKETETKNEESKSTSIQDKTGDAVSSEIEETVNPSADNSSSSVSDVGRVAEQAESVKTQASQVSFNSEQSESSSTSDLVKWAVSRIEAKLDGVISAIQNCGGNNKTINQYLQDNPINTHADSYSVKSSSDNPLYA